MPVEIAFEKHADVQVVALRGRLDASGSPELERQLSDAIGAGHNRLLIDCSELRYVSSAGLGAFLASAKLAQSSGGSMSFAGLTQHVRSVFDMVGFFSLFEVYSTREEGLAGGRGA
jgi:anti-sigma B factor antagonist